ncbi:MAG TPA: hypothetical protein H9796_05100, partial [Candidatus Butyricimonas faecavium]|nr:hypothetical protein [Candidatus Butyricimonas faecavium]
MKFFIIIFFVLLVNSVSAQFSLQGKLRTLSPVSIKVTDLAGNVIAECTVKNNEKFRTAPVHI